MISHKHKFLSLRIPKTGSTSVTNALEKYCDIHGNDDIESPYYFHQNATHMQDHFNFKKWVFADYYKFTFTRNPWDRIVSVYFYAHKEYKKLKNTNQMNKIAPWMNRVKSFNTFDEFIRYGTLRENAQYEFIKTEEPDTLDFIGKTETLQQDFDTVCDKIGIPKQKLPHTNKTKHKHYTEYYDSVTRDIVAEKYAKDIEYFGYEFGK